MFSVYIHDFGYTVLKQKILKSNISMYSIRTALLALIKLSYFIHDCHNFCHIIYIKFSRCLENVCWVAKGVVTDTFS